MRDAIYLGNYYGHHDGYDGSVFDPDGVYKVITATTGGIASIIEVGHIEKGTGKHQSNVVHSSDGIRPTLCAGIGVKQQPTMWLEVDKVVFGGEQEHQAIKTDGICTTLTSSMGTGGGYIPMVLEQIEPTKANIDVMGDLYEGNGHGSMGGRVYNPDGIAPSIGASHFQQIKYIVDLEIEHGED